MGKVEGPLKSLAAIYIRGGGSVNISRALPRLYLEDG